MKIRPRKVVPEETPEKSARNLFESNSDSKTIDAVSSSNKKIAGNSYFFLNFKKMLT